MRRELNEKIDGVDTKVTGVVTIVNRHETRIVIIENTRKTIRWLVGIGLVGLVAFLGNWIIHLPR